MSRRIFVAGLFALLQVAVGAALAGTLNELPSPSSFVGAEVLNAPSIRAPAHDSKGTTPTQYRQMPNTSHNTTAAPAENTSGARQASFFQEIGDWEVRCVSQPARQCQLSQRQVNPNTKQLVVWAELTRHEAPQPGWTIVVMVPLGFKASSILSLLDERGVLVQVVLATCVPNGCVYTAEMPSPVLEAMTKRVSLATRLANLQGKLFQLNISMRGFSESYVKSSQLMKAN